VQAAVAAVRRLLLSRRAAHLQETLCVVQRPSSGTLLQHHQGVWIFLPNVTKRMHIWRMTAKCGCEQNSREKHLLLLMMEIVENVYLIHSFISTVPYLTLDRSSELRDRTQRWVRNNLRFSTVSLALHHPLSPPLHSPPLPSPLLSSPLLSLLS